MSEVRNELGGIVSKQGVNINRPEINQTERDGADNLFVKTYSKKLVERPVIANKDNVPTSPESEVASTSTRNACGRSIRAARGIL